MWQIILILITLIIISALFFLRAVAKTGRGEEYTIIRELGTGAFGAVSEIELAGRRLALKREKVLGRTPYVTKIYSRVKAAPEYFVQVHSYRVVKCAWKHTPPDYLQNKALFDEEFRQKAQALEKSPYCLETIMEMCDEPLQAYLERDEVDPAPVSDKRKIVAQLLRSVDWAREHKIMIRDLHADNIMICGGAAKHIDYGEFTCMDDPNPGVDPEDAKYDWRVFGDLFSVIMLMFKPGITFKRYFSKLEKWPDITLLVEHCKRAGSWPRVQQLAVNIIDDEILDTEPGPEWNKIGRFLDFIYAAVDPANEEAYWREHVPDIVFPRTFIPAEDIIFMLENYWDMPALIKHFTD